ncbi:NUDIX domain-containing protein [Arthrobacter rhombi]|uniref:NUDIX hydrolase n=1 Tax=Arthrobacter rhombi TaxID=71253 RepID=UPI0031CFA1C1
MKAPAVPARDAATVVLLRDGDQGPEAFTMTRAATMAFSAGATVFPGGRVDPGDDLPEQFWSGTNLEWWGTRLGGDPATVRSLLAAAVRETFEECGVLLARPACSGSLADPRDFEQARSRLEEHELGFAEFLAAHHLVPDVTLLRPLSRWITPVGEPRRYDTRFILAALPAGQQARQATGEATATRWMDAGTAFRLFREGQTTLMPPTWSQFHHLQRFSSVDEALSTPADCLLVEPVIVPDTQPLRVRFPLEEAYYADSPHHL